MPSDEEVTQRAGSLRAMNLSHYSPVHPEMTHGHRKKCIEASGPTFPADDQAAILALDPGQCPLGLVARDLRVDRPSPRLAVGPSSRGHLGANPARAEAPAEVVGSIALLSGQPRASLAWAAPFTRANAPGIQPREARGPLVPMSGHRARGQRQAHGLREARDEDALACPARRAALPPAVARGTTNHRRRQTATESSRPPRPAPGGALAWRPASHRPASAAASAARRSWRPLGAPVGGHTSGSR